MLLAVHYRVMEHAEVWRIAGGIAHQIQREKEQYIVRNKSVEYITQET